jgi:glycerol-3-phosphate dehydrogenase (NAD(P)+)
MNGGDTISQAGVLGTGSWGTALAVLAAEGGRDVVLWGRQEEVVAEIAVARENRRHLPGVALPDTVAPTANLADLAGCDAILVVVPSSAMRPAMDALRQSKAVSDPRTALVSCSKGIERGSGLRMTQVIAEAFPANTVAVLSGPNHAEEVARRMAAAAVIGCGDHGVARWLQGSLATPWFRLYTSEDVPGIEWSGAAKNVFAIAAGIATGLGLGDNAKAALVTRGLAEMVRLGRAGGGRPETFLGLSGVGDLVVTCYSDHSRNNRFGRMLGEGRSTSEATAALGIIPEGLPNTESIYLAAARAAVRTPLIDAVHSVLYGGRDPRAVLAELFARDPRPEADEG